MSVPSIAVETNGTATNRAHLVGAILEGRYRVDARLARGGMSSVYRGMDLRLERPVAIKIMEPRLANDPLFLQRFELEARAAARLHHPNVVAVYDQGIDRSADDTVYLVMELIDGGTLRDLLREHRTLPVPLACSVLAPVLSALSAAHSAGLVHRDIKPENVLIGQGGAVKVGDFGLVRALASSGITGDTTILGTVAYLSPEQVATGGADARSDVYSAGVMLYEMLTGAPPYRGDNPLSVAYQHVNNDVPPPSETVPEIPAALDDLVLRATKRDPEPRPENATEFLAELNKITESLGIRPTTVPTPQQAFSETTFAHAELAGDHTTAVAPLGNGSPSIGPQGTRALIRTAPDEQIDNQTPASQYTEPIDPYQAQRRRNRRVALIVIAIIALLAATIGVGAWWLGSGRWTAVPALNGMNTSQAENVLQDADLTPKTQQAFDNSIPAGQVIGTTPSAGTRALRGSDISLIISAGKPIVPNITPGTALAAVQQAIIAADLQPRTDANSNSYDSNVPAGAVLRVVPASGTPLDVNSPVTVILSKGPAPAPIPDVIGLSHDQAFAELTAAGYQPYDEPAQFSADADAGTVINTDPAVGSMPSGNNRVGVVVSNAITLPDFSGEQRDTATSTLQSMGLQPEIQQFFGGKNGRVLTQSPSAGTRVPPGSQVILILLS